MASKNPNKGNSRNNLQEKGFGEVIRKTYYPENVEIDFRVYDSPLGDNNMESFSEKSVLNFVAQSYANSCLTLFHRIAEYNDSDKYSVMDNCALRYLPAMFCFRQYIELKLKYLYMYFTNNIFIITHDLSALLKEIKETGFNCSVFDSPINYIKERECFTSTKLQDDSYFRFLIDTKMNCEDHLNIPMFEFDTIKKFIIDIEFYTNQILNNLFIKKAKEKLS